ncbi:nitroreductase family protein [Rhodopila sp.]|jgi:nitroreductase|uniref:nitroreductase family protein n=1 Tax=Rhodopila sp. TaxID=2480087 RepID=UPI002D0C7D0E|nr:nitroreductase [Rhodopila sp.]HVZ07344.1 nitroreductase [Rhodopila sp.]
MDAMSLMLTRESALKLEAPGPSGAELDRMFASAVRAPDHGRLRPWAFVVIPEDRRAAFGDLLADSLRRRDTSVTEPELQREREKAFRAPVIIVVAAKLKPGTKIPDVEQIASAAAAAQTIMLAAPALGYGAVWKTGAPAYDDFVKTSLGLDPADEIVGFLYIGTRTGGSSPIPRPQAVDFVRTWQG